MPGLVLIAEQKLILNFNLFTVGDLIGCDGTSEFSTSTTCRLLNLMDDNLIRKHYFQVI